MKIKRKVKYIKIARKRERKRLRRLRKVKKGGSFNSPYHKINNFKRKVDREIIKRFKFPLYNFLSERGFITGKEEKVGKIEIPEDFSFSTNYEESIATIRNILVSLTYNSGGELVISFELCRKTDQAALFVLQIVKLDMAERLNSLNSRLSVLSSKVETRIKQSKSDFVNKMLFVNGFLKETEFKSEGLVPRRGIGYLRGSRTQRHYSENKKGPITTKIRNFINDCLRDHGYEFTSEDVNEMDGLLSEILGNGEDHSPFDTYYATANSFIEVKGNNEVGFVGEVNLCVMNFGYSIYEGLEKTREENKENYALIEDLYQEVFPLVKLRTITKENLFTLYALQEGISRLKYLDQSRGHGTMKFIRSFFALGDYEDDGRQYHPELSIISGSTQVSCDNKYPPITINEQNFLTLNSEKTLKKPPDPTRLKNLKTLFPGTLLTVKMYLHSEHLRKKFDGA